MASSKRWKDLRKEIVTLRKHFLPARFDPLGSYTNPKRTHAHTRAFLVLSHAEIETYLEEWAKEIVGASQAVWNSSGRIPEPLAFLLAFHAERIEAPTTVLASGAKDSRQRLEDAIVKLYDSYYKKIRDNHGIKESNVLAIFAPLGIPSSALGTTLLPNLDSLGSRRGYHAHHSVRAVITVLDPETEYNRVNDVVNELQALDTWLANYKRRIR